MTERILPVYSNPLSHRIGKEHLTVVMIDEKSFDLLKTFDLVRF